MLSRKIILPFTSVGGNLNEILKEKLEEELMINVAKKDILKQIYKIVSYQVLFKKIMFILMFYLNA